MIMLHVTIITGPNKGKTALLREDGFVQLDGPTDLWRHGERARDRYPLCYGWHDPEGRVAPNNSPS